MKIETEVVLSRDGGDAQRDQYRQWKRSSETVVPSRDGGDAQRPAEQNRDAKAVHRIEGVQVCRDAKAVGTVLRDGRAAPRRRRRTEASRAETSGDEQRWTETSRYGDARAVSE